jgi:hypothetical protein
MSAAALEHLRADTLYVATTGGMGPGMISAIERALWALSTRESGELVIASDGDDAGRSLRRPSDRDGRCDRCETDRASNGRRINGRRIPRTSPISARIQKLHQPEDIALRPKIRVNVCQFAFNEASPEYGGPSY